MEGKAQEDKLIELHKQINMDELAKILKGITRIHSKNQKQMLPNIDGNKRFHMSYGQLNLKD